MRKMLKAWLFTMLLLLPCMLASASSLYPDTLDNGNYVCVDGGMGVGKSAFTISGVGKIAGNLIQVDIF